MASETRSFRSKSLKCLKPITDMKECRDAYSKGTHLRVCERGESTFHQNKARTHMSARLINMIQGSAGWCEG